MKSLAAMATTSACRVGALIALLSLAPGCYGAEALSPFLPGITTGIPLGALPPNGLYVTDQLYWLTGNLVSGSGEEVPVSLESYANALTILWSSPWHVLGATYGAAITQPAESNGIDARGVGGTSTRNFAVFNTILQPAILSWSLGHGVFLSLSQTIYVKNGTFNSKNGVRLQTSYANNFWTYEPSVAVSYFGPSYTFTANVAYDAMNTTNHATHYRTGHIAYLDWTIERHIGHLDIGLVGNYTKQLTSDRHFGRIVAPDGNRLEHVMVGPIAGYTFGNGWSLSARYLANAYTRNDFDISILFLSISKKVL